MADRLKELYDEVVKTLREDMHREGRSTDPVRYVEDEVARWRQARESDEGIWFSLVIQMIRHGFPGTSYSHDMQPVLKEQLGDFEALADMDEKGKKKLAEVEELGLNLQKVRSVAKNARTMKVLQEDFGSVVDLISSFESEEDLAAGVEEMFSYIKGRGPLEFTREMGWKKPGSSPGVRRFLSRMRDLVDGSLDLEGIVKAIEDMAAATGRSVEEIDFLLELFASGDDRIRLHAICDVQSACYRCLVSDAQCAERRYEFGTAREIIREEQE